MMWWIIAAVALFSVAVILAACKVSSRISRMEEAEELKKGNDNGKVL